MHGFPAPSAAARAAVPGAAFRTTAADRGIVERPLLAPHMEARAVGAEAALLASETSSAALYGRIYADLLPLLDGTRTRREVAAALAASWRPVALQTALVELARKNYVVSADFAMSADAAAFWCALGASPRYAEERLGAARASVAGGAPRLAAALRALDVVVADDGADDSMATLAVAATDDYLDKAHAEINRRRLASGAPWMLVRAGGVAPLFGPVFRPREGGPCWACLAHRMRANREAESFLRATARSGGAIPPRAAAEPFADSALSLAAVEIAKWIVFGADAPLHDHALSLDALRFGGARHPVARRPQCAACGSPELRRRDRAPAPIALAPSPGPVRNSGGVRAVPPEETLRRYRRLIGPVSGVVRDLARVVEEDDSWLHIYWAASALSLRDDNFFMLRGSARGKSSGKGSTAAQARASALCEAVERHSGVFHGDEIRRRARLADFPGGDAIHPNDALLYSERQYERAAEINARGSRFNYVPARFDPQAEMDWTPIWSLTAERHRWLPTSMLYLAAPHENGIVYCGPDTNGCAAGNTLEEAILQGFLELAERDAFACWWYNRARLPEADLDSFGDPWLSRARGYYAAWRREMWVLDATNDLGVPAFVGVSRRTDKEAEDIIFAAGAHLDPHIAALRAVSELNQLLGAVRGEGLGGGYVYDDPECLRWWREAKLADNPWLAPRPDAAPRGAGARAAPATGDVRDDVELCRALVERKGMEFLVLDQTRPDIGMPVAKTIVPGLRPFWMRNAPGRLYDVPVAMGWRAAPISEDDLNPVPVFI